LLILASKHDGKKYSALSLVNRDLLYRSYIREDNSMSFGDQFHIEIRKPQDPWNTTVNSDQWFKTTEDALRKIQGTTTGKALLQAVLDSSFWIAMEPLNFDVCNAHGAGRLEIQKTRTFKGAVKFDPKVFEEGSHCFKSRLGKKEKRGGLADEVLFHELIHALRGGLEVNSDKMPVSGGLWRYSNTEEFYAVVITNIYISDESNKGSSGLRAGHRGKLPLEQYFSRSLCFFASSTQILPLLKKFENDHPVLFNSLSKVKARFNPIGAMVDFPVAVEKISKAKATKDHEKGAEKHQKWLEDRRLAEVRTAMANQAAQDQKDLESLMASIGKATPDQIAQQLGLFGKEAVEILKKWH
jgi:hypothetical protein